MSKIDLQVGKSYKLLRPTAVYYFENGIPSGIEWTAKTLREKSKVATLKPGERYYVRDLKDEYALISKAPDSKEVYVVPRMSFVLKIKEEVEIKEVSLSKKDLVKMAIKSGWDWNEFISRVPMLDDEETKELFKKMGGKV